jgi:GAF domain-containing protein
MAGSPDLLAFRRAGIRSAQMTPMLSRGGKLLGMISTHWNEPHQPPDRDLRLPDILARQAADLLERAVGDEALRARYAPRLIPREHVCWNATASSRYKNVAIRWPVASTT